MLSIHYISVMMWIFYIDRQQYWKCDWNVNIGTNAHHGKRTVSTKQPRVTDLTVGFQWYQRGIEVVCKSLDCFTVWLVSQCDHFVSLHQADYENEGGGAQLQCIYYSMLHTELEDRQGYFDVRMCYYDGDDVGSLLRIQRRYQLHKNCNLCEVFHVNWRNK